MNFYEHARVRSCYYEWQFWEMSWTYQDWVGGEEA